MSDREIMNAKRGITNKLFADSTPVGPDVHSYIGRWKFAVHDLAEQIVPVIGEQIQETIAWQSDGYKFAEHLEGDDYIQFANEVRTEILKQLQDI
jgi:hypothetical protein